jgi:lysophospholipase L1-like esterase
VGCGRLLALGLTVLASAEVTSRVEDRLRFDTELAAVPSDEDLVVRDEFGIRGRPNARYKKWKLNAFGFRSDEITFAPPVDCQRVMVLGASESFGLYESPGKEFPAQLAAALRPHGCYEVVNGAIAGMTVRTIGSFWDHWASRFNPDTVVIYPTPAFYLGDVRPADTPLPGPVEKPIERPVRWWTPRMLDRARDVIQIPPFIQRQRVKRWLEEARAGRPSGWLYDTVPEQRLLDFIDDMELLACKVSDGGAQAVVVTHASAFHDPPRREELDALQAWNASVPRATPSVLLEFERKAAEELLKLAASRGLIFVDAASYMNGRSEWFAGDRFHFSDEGASVIANLIATQLRRSPPSQRPGGSLACSGERAHAVQ